MSAIDMLFIGTTVVVTVALVVGAWVGHRRVEACFRALTICLGLYLPALLIPDSVSKIHRMLLSVSFWIVVWTIYLLIARRVRLRQKETA